jgi:3-hydroxyisobutyrate dehydrogenase-like beta-hydroxyacid dehydrogenase
VLRNAANALPGKTIIEFSTGDAEDAEELAGFLAENGAGWMLGNHQCLSSDDRR